MKAILVSLTLFLTLSSYAGDVLECTDEAVVEVASKLIDESFYEYYMKTESNQYDSHVQEITQKSYSSKRGMRTCHASVKLSDAGESELMPFKFGARFSVDDKNNVTVIRLIHPF